MERYNTFYVIFHFPHTFQNVFPFPACLWYKTDELCNEVKNQPTIETETLFSRLKSEVKSPTPAGL